MFFWKNGTDTKAIERGGEAVEGPKQVWGRTKKQTKKQSGTKKKNTKSVRSFHRKNSESKREEPYVTDLVDDQRDEKLGTARKEMKQGGVSEEEDWSVHTISYREVALWVDGVGLWTRVQEGLYRTVYSRVTSTFFLGRRPCWYLTLVFDLGGDLVFDLGVMYDKESDLNGLCMWACGRMSSRKRLA
jgi:hypothetical protein